MTKKQPTPDDLFKKDSVEAASHGDLLVEDDEVYELEVADDNELGEGKYLAKATDFEVTESSTGNKQFKVSFRIIEPGYVGRQMTAWLSLLPQVRWRLIPQLRAFGIEPEGETVRVKKSLIVGKYVTLELKKRTWQGETRVQMNNIL